MNVLKWFFVFTVLSTSSVAQEVQIWKSYYDSTQMFWARDWPRTVALLERAERSAHHDLDPYDENYLTILNDLGTAYWKSKNYQQAEELLTRSLAMKAEVYPHYDKEVVLSMYNLAGFYAEQGNLTRSKSLYRNILSAGPGTVPPDIYLNTAQNLVALFEQDYKTDSALWLLTSIDGLNIIEAGSYHDYRQQLFRGRLQRMARAYLPAEETLASLVKMMAPRSEAELIPLLVEARHELGLLYLETGAYSDAEKNLLRAHEHATAGGDETFLTGILNSLAQVYEKLGIYHKALAYYRQAYARCVETNRENSLAGITLLNNIAGIQLKENQVDQSIAGYQKVTEVLESLVAASDPLFVTALNNLATAYRRNNQHKQAQTTLARAARLLARKDPAQDDLAAAIYNNMAIVHTALGEHEAAATHYRKAYDIKRRTYGDDSTLLLDIVSNLAVSCWALDRPDEAIPLFKKSMQLATRLVTYVFPNLNAAEQVQFYAKLHEDVERFNTIALQWHDRDEELLGLMFQNRMIIKSLQFFTDQRRSSLIGEKNDPALNQLVSLIRAKRTRLGQLYQLPSHIAQLEGGSMAALEREVDELEKKLSHLTSEEIPNHFDRGVSGIKAISAKLAPAEAVVELVRFRKYDSQQSKRKNVFGFTDSVYYAALILTSQSGSKPDLVLFRDGMNMEGRYFQYYKNALRYQQEDTLSYHVFWTPIETLLPGKSRIYLSPDGVYHKLSVNTLKDPRSGQFLLEKADVHQLLNPAQLLLEKESGRAPGRRHAVLMGDPLFSPEVQTTGERTVKQGSFTPLPGTDAELRAIDKLLKSRSWTTSLFLKARASEGSLKAVKSPYILHLASHGFFSSDVVAVNADAKNEFLFHSGIALSGANKSLAAGSTTMQDDGIITAFEVMNLNLANTHLVVLSACETGLGKIENGEGVFGLQRAFMQAGARNVLISLWKVDDMQTKDLMVKFYQYYSQGDPFTAALKKAQLDQLRGNGSPLSWGGFVLVGNN